MSAEQQGLTIVKEGKLARLERPTEGRMQQYMPVLDVEAALYRRQQILDFMKGVMVEDVDYGQIPGTAKPTLYKSGAEKLACYFGYTPIYVEVKTIEAWRPDNEFNDLPFFYYHQKCRLYKGGDPDHGGVLIAEADASCNSQESRYCYRWVPEHEVPGHLNKANLAYQSGVVSEFKFAIDKAETSGRYGKPAEYWQRFKDEIAAGRAREFTKSTRGGDEYLAYEIGGMMFRIPNDDITSQVNTILKMSQKRALVAVILLALSASELFTQDLDDMDTESGGAVNAPTGSNDRQKGGNKGKGRKKDQADQQGTGTPSDRKAEALNKALTEQFDRINTEDKKHPGIKAAAWTALKNYAAKQKITLPMPFTVVDLPMEHKQPILAMLGKIQPNVDQAEPKDNKPAPTVLEKIQAAIDKVITDGVFDDDQQALSWLADTIRRGGGPVLELHKPEDIPENLREAALQQIEEN